LALQQGLQHFTPPLRLRRRNAPVVVVVDHLGLAYGGCTWSGPAVCGVTQTGLAASVLDCTMAATTKQ